MVIIGDTGCRISIGNVYQACGDPTHWPFSVIASAAAAMQPDLVLHVGDYQYRDNPCPPGNTACTGTPWGYGSDTWAADLFAPAAPLLAAAPWVMVRGNHELCNRAGQGWYRYLDPNPYDATGVKTCNDPANDNVGNYNDPWAVSFGDTQFVVVRLVERPEDRLLDPPAFQPYTAELAAAATLVDPEPAEHLSPSTTRSSATRRPTRRRVGSPGMQSVMNAAFPGNYYPPNTAIAIHGHVHDFQAFNFASNHPATFVAGNGGDNLDSALPATFNPNADLPAPSTVVNAFAYSQEFGFMVMDRVGAVGTKNWKFTSYRTNGHDHRGVHHGSAGRLQRRVRHHARAARSPARTAAAAWSAPTTTSRSRTLQPGEQEAASWRRLATGAALVWRWAPRARRLPEERASAAAKPTIARRWAAAKIPKLPRAPVIPARRTNVLPVPPREGPPDDPALVALGKKIFFDERLSEPPGTSCASCHDPARAFSGGHGSPHRRPAREPPRALRAAVDAVRPLHAVRPRVPLLRGRRGPGARAARRLLLGRALRQPRGAGAPAALQPRRDERRDAAASRRQDRARALRQGASRGARAGRRTPQRRSCAASAWRSRPT